MEENLSQTTTSISRIAFVGPECTGKTTICTKLAHYFQTQWVPEYMRIYLQKKWDETQQVCQWEDLLPIASGQMFLENQKVQQANEFLFCDTNLLEITMYSYIYYGKCPTEIETSALAHRYDIIFLAHIDVPWQADDLRDKPNERTEVLAFFKKYLSQKEIPYIFLKGSETERFDKVISILKQKYNFELENNEIMDYR